MVTRVPTAGDTSRTVRSPGGSSTSQASPVASCSKRSTHLKAKEDPLPAPPLALRAVVHVGALWNRFSRVGETTLPRRSPYGGFPGMARADRPAGPPAEARHSAVRRARQALAATSHGALACPHRTPNARPPLRRPRGDSSAIIELVDRASPELCRLARSPYGDPQRADDLLQETLLSAIRRDDPPIGGGRSNRGSPRVLSDSNRALHGQQQGSRPPKVAHLPRRVVRTPVLATLSPIATSYPVGGAVRESEHSRTIIGTFHLPAPTEILTVSLER